MKQILFLPHRIPYPPNKGDKIRSFHILRKLSQAFQVHLATFVDRDDDWQYCDPVRQFVDESYFCPLVPWRAKLKSLTGLLEGCALSLPYYRDRRLSAWIEELLSRRKIDGIFVFSSAMAQYAMGAQPVVDFVDVDSAKWCSYAAQTHWPMKWVYAREGERLLQYERAVASACRKALFVSNNEARLFRDLAPEVSDKIAAMDNGVDASFFSPTGSYENPFPAAIEPLVFTGAMDYWPNVDAMVWFIHEVLPAVVRQRPQVRIYVVGAHPSPSVVKLGRCPNVVVTGTVPDVRPYLAHARAVVVPLRIARGVQNKVLEAMAMAKPLIVSPESMCGIALSESLDLLIANGAAEWIAGLLSLDSLPGIAEHNRRFIESRYDWDRNLQMLESLW